MDSSDHHNPDLPSGLSPGDNALIDAISDRMEREFGPIHSVHHELISPLIHLDVHLIKPTQQHPYNILFTTGMAELPMRIPAGAKVPAFTELMIKLDPEWPLGKLWDITGGNANTDPDADGSVDWPRSWLKVLARFPHEERTWLGHGHTVPSHEQGDPSPTGIYDASLMLYASQVNDNDALMGIELPDGRAVTMLEAICLRPEETAFKIQSGTDQILSHLKRLPNWDVLQHNRRSALPRKKFLGIF